MFKSLFLFDITGIAAKPWFHAGAHVTMIDLMRPPGVIRLGNRCVSIGMDILDFTLRYRSYDFIAAFPPCTDMATSGRASFKRKGLPRVIDALKLFSKAVELCEENDMPYFIENPVSTVSSYYRKPDYSFHPFEYGYYLNPPIEGYKKRTCLWTGNGFIMPPKRPVDMTLPGFIQNMPDNTARAFNRSKTPLGFSTAVCQYNFKPGVK